MGFDATRLGSERVLHTRTSILWLDLYEVLSRIFKGVEPPAVGPMVVDMHRQQVSTSDLGWNLKF